MPTYFYFIAWGLVSVAIILFFRQGTKTDELENPQDERTGKPVQTLKSKYSEPLRSHYPMGMTKQQWEKFCENTNRAGQWQLQIKQRYNTE